MIKLRPHHLMCTVGYSGKGYSVDFVENMNKVTGKLKEESTEIELVFNTDDICVKCPSRLGEDKCSSNQKVKTIDSKVISYFNLEEKNYIYEEVVNYIKDNITEDIMADICETCQWYAISNCKKRLLP